MEEQFQTELRCRRRRKHESLSELAQDVRRLMALAYPGEKSTLAEHLARDAFLSALNDPDFELRICEKDPPDLDTALKYAQRYEVSKNVVDATSDVRLRHRAARQVIGEQDIATTSFYEPTVKVAAMTQRHQQTSTKSGADTAELHGGADAKEGRERSQLMQPTGVQQPESRTPNGPRGRRRNRAVNHDAAERQDQLAQKMRELEIAQSCTRERAERLAAENDALNKRLDRLKYLEQLHLATTTRASQGRSVDGQTTPQVINGPEGGDRARRPGNCWTCGEMGHFSRSCPRTQLHQQSAQYHRGGRSCSCGTRAAYGRPCVIDGAGTCSSDGEPARDTS